MCRAQSLYFAMAHKALTALGDERRNKVIAPYALWCPLDSHILVTKRQSIARRVLIPDAERSRGTL